MVILAYGGSGGGGGATTAAYGYDGKLGEEYQFTPMKTKFTYKLGEGGEGGAIGVGGSQGQPTIIKSEGFGDMVAAGGQGGANGDGQGGWNQRGGGGGAGGIHYNGTTPSAGMKGLYGHIIIKEYGYVEVENPNQ